MSSLISIPMVECHGGPLDGYVCRWPIQDGQPAPTVELRYAAYCESEDGETELVIPDYRTAVYSYVDRKRVVWVPGVEYNQERRSA